MRPPSASRVPRRWGGKYRGGIGVMDGARETWTHGWLVPFLLLSMRDGEHYGHELLERMGELGFEGTRPGEIYRTLRLLEGEGLTFSERGKVEYLLSRRRYGLTEDGVAYLEFLAHSLELYRRKAESFLLAYEGQPAYGVLR